MATKLEGAGRGVNKYDFIFSSGWFNVCGKIAAFYQIEIKTRYLMVLLGN